MLGARSHAPEAGARSHAPETGARSHGDVTHADVPPHDDASCVRVPLARYVASNTIYLISLFVLYLFSTLYHSMFALGDTVVEIFATFDQCAIYMLIAGSYTPFLIILFPDKAIFSVGLLAFLWIMAACGVALQLCYHGPLKVGLQVTSYLGMGWAAVLCASDMWERLAVHPQALFLIIGGGLSYTGGVPFFIKDGRTLNIPDHTIWHLFVIGGSMAHYFCVLWYLVPFPYPGHVPWDADCCS